MRLEKRRCRSRRFPYMRKRTKPRLPRKTVSQRGPLPLVRAAAGAGDGKVRALSRMLRHVSTALSYDTECSCLFGESLFKECPKCSETLVVGIVAECSPLAGLGDGPPFILVRQKIFDFINSISDARVSHDFFSGFKVVAHIVLVVGKEESADAGRLPQPHITSLGVLRRSVHIERYFRIRKHLEHRKAENAAMVVKKETPCIPVVLSSHLPKLNEPIFLGPE